ncbi:MAG: methyltransferase family protein [Pyrinomonadaceae bacterium]
MTTESSKLPAAKIILTIIYLLIYPALLLGLSGDWSWIEGWIFSVWFFALCAAIIIYLYKKDPALLAERYRKPGTGGAKGWDKYFLYTFLILFFVWFIVMPLDAKRLAWSAEFPLRLKIVGAILLAVSSFFLFRSFSDNTFLSPAVRIQTERRQQVVSSGVYRFVRHPMYLGAVCLFIGAPLFLSSKYGILIGLLMTIILMARIVGEEKMLIGELKGYVDYRKKVKYRLIPFVW